MRPKEQIAAVSKRLRDAAKLQEPHALSVVQLLVLLAEEAKERLITAEGDELLREQGAFILVVVGVIFIILGTYLKNK